MIFSVSVFFHDLPWHEVIKIKQLKSQLSAIQSPWGAMDGLACWAGPVGKRNPENHSFLTCYKYEYIYIYI